MVVVILMQEFFATVTTIKVNFEQLVMFFMINFSILSDVVLIRSLFEKIKTLK